MNPPAKGSGGALAAEGGGDAHVAVPLASTKRTGKK